MDNPSNQLSQNTYKLSVLSKVIYSPFTVYSKHSQFDIGHLTVIGGWWCAKASTLKQKS